MAAKESKYLILILNSHLEVKCLLYSQYRL